ncbi:cardiotrophin-like cytokine factor 1 [Amia ocellicauda]|uniref:cardiotrophin-like cytokine factor 1 n=1 Tax=Amia ocellicauda TaxID=2972642 RepID=UPI003464D704
MRTGQVRPAPLALLLAVAVGAVRVPALGVGGDRSTLERTYELTKYLEHQLKDIKHTYLSYLGPPFSDPDFAPPRPNCSALALPSAATRFELWKGLENRVRLLQNHRAYSLLLGSVRELARSTLCPYLQRSLLHFCTGLDGLLGSISGLMTSLGYPLPPTAAPAPSPGPGFNDFSRKVESFWVLRELQSWLWRSAKDFNRLKKRLRV